MVNGGGRGGGSPAERVRRERRGREESVLASVMKSSSVSFTLVSKSLDRLLGTLKGLESLQTTALGIGTTANLAMEGLSKTVDRVPGGMGLALEHAMGFAEAGFKTVNKGMLTVAAQAKLTGKDSVQVIQGLAELGAVLPISTEKMGELSQDLIKTSFDHGITTTALIGALQENIATLQRLAAVSPEMTGKMTTAIGAVVSELGINQKANVTKLAQMISLQGGLQDLPKLFPMLGSELVEEIRQGNFSLGLMKEIAAKGNQFSKENLDAAGGLLGAAQERLKGLGIDTQTLGALVNLNNAFERSTTEERTFTQRANQKFNTSITAAVATLKSAFQIIVMPAVKHLAAIGGWISDMAEHQPEIISRIRSILKYLIGYIVATRIFRGLEKGWEMMKAAWRLGDSAWKLAGGGWAGALALATVQIVGAVTATVLATNYVAGKIEDLTKEEERANRAVAAAKKIEDPGAIGTTAMAQSRAMLEQRIEEWTFAHAGEGDDIRILRDIATNMKKTAANTGDPGRSVATGRAGSGLNRGP